MNKANLFHDQCDDYLQPLVPAPHQSVRVKVRVSGNVQTVYLCITEKLFFAAEDDYARFDMTLEREKNGYKIYACDFSLSAATIRYKFVACGVDEILCETDAFLLVPGYDTPAWSKRAVWYQIMPDSFYNADLWSDKPTGGTVKENAWGNGHFGGEDYFGGDLDGIIQKLDYLQEMGVTAISVNPIWAATHQAGYGADDLTDVDACFGGDAALIRLREETAKRGMRLCLDGVFDYLIYKSKYCNRDKLYPLKGGTEQGDPYYDWFLRDTAGNGISSIWAHPLADFSCDAFRDFVYRAENSVVKTYLRPPYSIDGWRMDVGNIYEGSDPAHFGNAVDVMREMREHIKSVHPEKLLITENDLPKMRAYAVADSKWNYELGLPVRDWAAGRLTSEQFADAATESVTMLPRPMAQACFNHVTTHDTARILDTVNGNENAAYAATLLHLLFVGAPSIYFGDEIGMRATVYPHMGLAAPASFGSMNWDRDTWNMRFKKLYTALGKLRTEYADFFASAGCEFVCAECDIAAFVRFEGDTICVALGNRADEETSVTLDLSAYIRQGDLRDVFTGQTLSVNNGKIVLRVPAGGTVLCPCGWSIVAPVRDAEESGMRLGYDDRTFAVRVNVKGGLCVTQDEQSLRFALAEKGLQFSLCGVCVAETVYAGDVWLQLEKSGARWSACYSADGIEWQYLVTGFQCNFSEGILSLHGNTSNFRVGDGKSRRRDYKAKEYSLNAREYARSLVPPCQHIADGDFAYVYGGIEQRSTGRSKLTFDGTFTFFKAAFTVTCGFTDKDDFAGLRFGEGIVGVRQGALFLSLDGREYTIPHENKPVSLIVLTTGKRLLVLSEGYEIFSEPYACVPCTMSFVGKGRYTLTNYAVWHDSVPYFAARGTVVAMDEGWDISSQGCEYGYLYALQPLTDFVLSANFKFNVSANAFPDGYFAVNFGIKAYAYPEREGISVRFYKDRGRVEIYAGENLVASEKIAHLDNESFYAVLSYANGKLRLSVAPNEFSKVCRTVIEVAVAADGGCLLFAVRNARAHICNAHLCYANKGAEQSELENVRIAPSKHRYML